MSLVISRDFRSVGGRDSVSRGAGTVKAGRETFILRFVAESASAPLKHPQEAAGLRGTKLGVRVTKARTKHELTGVSAWRLSS